MTKDKGTTEADFAKINDILAVMNDANVPDANAEWEKFDQVIEKHGSSKVVSMPTNKMLVLFSAAASIVIVIGISLFINNRGVDYRTTNNLMAITLNDGSIIQLNQNTTLHHKLSYGWFNRNVSLTGEAYFQVAKNGTVFKVKTNEACVKVTGTCFNVKSAEGITETGVDEGRVEFSSFADNDVVVALTKGLFSTCKKGETPQLAVGKESAEVGLWRNVKLVYRDEKVANIIADIEKIYNIKIHIKDKAIIELVVTGVLEGKSTDELIENLCLSINKKYRKNGNEYEIY